MNKLLIGIDPDLIKSGVALYYKESKKLDLQLRDFFSLINLLESIECCGYEVEVVIEAGWLNPSANHHSHPLQSKAVGERIAKNVGENAAVGKLIEQFCIQKNLKHRLYKPTKSKTTPVMFNKITGLDVKNQEMIDAAMMVYGI